MKYSFDSLQPDDLQPIEWVEVPYFANGVQAGVPTDIGDCIEETILIPRAKPLTFCVASIREQNPWIN